MMNHGVTGRDMMSQGVICNGVNYGMASRQVLCNEHAAIERAYSRSSARHRCSACSRALALIHSPFLAQRALSPMAPKNTLQRKEPQFLAAPLLKPPYCSTAESLPQRKANPEQRHKGHPTLPPSSKSTPHHPPAARLDLLPLDDTPRPVVFHIMLRLSQQQGRLLLCRRGRCWRGSNVHAMSVLRDDRPVINLMLESPIRVACSAASGPPPLSLT